MTNETPFVYRFEPSERAGAPPLLLLHGTGGDESDLLELGRMLSPDSALLSPRGRVLENGMPRFFRRLAGGVFDEDDVRRRAAELADFVDAMRRRLGIGAPVAVGYSNGANIAAAMMLLRPGTLSGAILLRAMVPLSDPPRPDLAGAPVLVAAGQMDPIVTASNSAKLAEILGDAGADVTHRTLPAGHQLSQADLVLTREWLERVKKRTLQST
ncbi:alpha/beta hydrolase [Bradyrhizobium neotropicale]|uniref:alpha/beta hydrolase n=1 Tax=Bradyrhizobium neotropicale TaxID=1497615 RepID=UPI001AD7D70C|nr:alpha/beta hydrolase [Bradyrhizobium neotropicale]MBO4227435.1 alpha/beta hydrolase [Bradyrhizobium neotropicale]